MICFSVNKLGTTTTRKLLLYYCCPSQIINTNLLGTYTIVLFKNTDSIIKIRVILLSNSMFSLGVRVYLYNCANDLKCLVYYNNTITICRL